MKCLLRTDVDDSVPSKYFEGRVIDKHLTVMGHLCFMCVDVKEIVVVDGVKIVLMSYPTGNYVIPKRRLEVFELAKREVRYNGVYVFKLQEESKSKKWMVAQVLEVKNDE